MIEYMIGPARYAKGKVAVSCPSHDGWKTRAARLAVRFSNCRYSGRENAYIMSAAAAAKFEQHFADGWDYIQINNKLIAPEKTNA